MSQTHSYLIDTTKRPIPIRMRSDLSIETIAYQDFEDYHPLSEDELDAELDAIDEDERTKSEERTDAKADQPSDSENPTTDSNDKSSDND